MKRIKKSKNIEFINSLDNRQSVLFEKINLKLRNPGDATTLNADECHLVLMAFAHRKGLEKALLRQTRLECQFGHNTGFGSFLDEE